MRWAAVCNVIGDEGAELLEEVLPCRSAISPCELLRLETFALGTSLDSLAVLDVC